MQASIARSGRPFLGQNESVRSEVSDACLETTSRQLSRERNQDVRGLISILGEEERQRTFARWREQTSD